MHRTIFNSLQKWAAADRKVMLLRGARQVGKTYAVRHLAKSFDSFLEVNFEEEKEVRSRQPTLPLSGGRLRATITVHHDQCPLPARLVGMTGC